jgi:hypothetical protein
VSSVGFCAECECENVAHKIGTIILLRQIYSGDIQGGSNMTGTDLCVNKLPTTSLF